MLSSRKVSPKPSPIDTTCCGGYRPGAGLGHSVPAAGIPEADVVARCVLNVGVDLRGPCADRKVQIDPALKEVPLAAIVEIDGARVAARGIEPGEVHKRLARMSAGLVSLGLQKGERRAAAIDA